MTNHLVAVTLVAALATLAHADARAALTPEQIAAAEQAQRAALPPVDQVATKRCTKPLDTYNRDPQHAGAALVFAADCYARAGAVGAAIQMWEMLAKEDAGADGLESKRRLGPAFERAGMYARAAAAHLAYATAAYAAHDVPTDARAQVVRAICTARQLDDADGLRDGLALLHAHERGDASAATLCKTIRPIAPPIP